MGSAVTHVRTAPRPGRWHALLAAGIGLTIGLAFTGAAALADTPDPLGTVVGTIPVGGWPDGLAVDPSGTYVYVANWNDDTVSVIDLTTDTVSSTIPVGAGPYAIAIDPSGTYAYVTNANDDAVSVLAGPPEVITASVPAGVTGAAYTTLIQTAGAGPITCAITTGTLPDGLSLDPATCEISGTPTAAGDWSFTITATGPGGTAPHDYAMTVTADPTSTPDPAPAPDPGTTAELARTGTNPRGPLTVSLTMIANDA